jgi:riboflavin kinase/FMN adenylyltransferase
MLDKEKMPTVLALGYFDSVHVGHRKVIEKAKEYAVSHGAMLTVVTFGGNLRAVLSGAQDKTVYLTKERKELLKQAGADEVYFAPVSANFLSKGKLAYLNMLNKKYKVICYVCGDDYRFGKSGKGNTQDIVRYAKSHNQHSIILDIEKDCGKKISTSYIKELLTSGNVKKANRLLGIPYFVTGKVFEDRKVGRDLGFPTLNVKIDSEKHSLKNGVYSGHIYIDGKKHKTIINYGCRPTFDLCEKLVEAHVLDFNGNLYGKEVKLYFDEFMRDIQKFLSADELKNQLQKDLNAIKERSDD